MMGRVSAPILERCLYKSLQKAEQQQRPWIEASRTSICGQIISTWGLWCRTCSRTAEVPWVWVATWPLVPARPPPPPRVAAVRWKAGRSAPAQPAAPLRGAVASASRTARLCRCTLLTGSGRRMERSAALS
ncbi:UNVERIFIED_CONTAM: hypothetical protein FKN15_035231 [Acipenser sinensis]